MWDMELVQDNVLDEKLTKFTRNLFILNDIYVHQAGKRSDIGF